LAELEAKLESLKQKNLELTRCHTLATERNQSLKEDRGDLNSNLAKELALNNVLREKNGAERAVLEYN